MARTTIETTSADVDARNAERFAGWAGLAFATVFAGFLVMVVQVPALSEPADEIHRWLLDNEGLNRVTSFVFWLALLFLLLPFAVALAGRVERTGGAQQVLARLMLAGVIMSIVLFSFDTFVGVALGLDGRLTELSPENIGFQVVFDANKLFLLAGFHLAMGLWIAAASIALLRTHIAPRWIGWLGVGLLAPQIVAASWVVGGQLTAVHDALAGLGIIGSFLVWLPAASVSMLRGFPSSAASSAPVKTAR